MKKYYKNKTFIKTLISIFIVVFIIVLHYSKKEKEMLVQKPIEKEIHQNTQKIEKLTDSLTKYEAPTYYNVHNDSLRKWILSKSKKR